MLLSLTLSQQLLFTSYCFSINLFLCLLFTLLAKVTLHAKVSLCKNDPSYKLKLRAKVSSCIFESFAYIYVEEFKKNCIHHKKFLKL